ncbi:outer membrane protein OmpA-like peptidoglycan-associated protein [Halospina denitrificans]|uniref:Outer membrane protein OmpA-like peptidoglycan-associated protein n=1 Tax=Halospina denitrificans TaxID=332522 RepID=A0A4R7K089_9GAMM|nr:OmpA family protein [Halospina denitrificans]TDT43347.1 outer membrane protein OmpA-like peptidoglycan-associated protein [Halospina denitrificans]
MKKVLMAVVVSAAMISGCATQDAYTGEEKTSKTMMGGIIGAVTGAAAGAATSSKGDRNKGILIGAASGGLIGAGVGQYMDRQEAQLRQRLEGTGVRVKRDGNQIDLIMPGNITFDVDKSNIRTSFYEVLDSVAIVVKEFDQTAIAVGGHTDSTGSFEYNQQLSERRAQSVGSYLRDKGVAQGRLHTKGYGPRFPVASNDTEQGRQQNRRVEIQLMPME